MHLRCISRNRIHRRPMSCRVPVPSSRPLFRCRPSPARYVDGNGRQSSRAKNTQRRDTEKRPRLERAFLYARGHVFVINRARCLTLGFQRGLIFQTARFRNAGGFSLQQREMRRNFYALVSAVGKRDEKRKKLTRRYLSRVINAIIDMKISLQR